MIDPVAFAAEMTILQNRFPGARNMTAETIARYLDYLDGKLNTTEFQTAAREIFNHDTFWPSPQRFIEAVKGDPKAASEEAWNSVLIAATRGDGQAITPTALATLRSIGVTFRDVETAGEYQLQQIGKRFRAHLERGSGPDQLALEETPAELEFLQ